MFRQVVFALAAFIVIVFLILWVIGGGPRRSLQAAHNIVSFTPPSVSGFRLPWQPAQLFPTIDISTMLQADAGTGGLYDAQQQLEELNAEYERLAGESAAARTSGTPSPYAGIISIARDSAGVRAADPNEEYIELMSDYRAGASVDITGWSLESALSGTAAYIPGAASPFMMGAMNLTGSTILDPGGIAIVTSAPSPVGASFRENICTGYLDQFQTFSPALGNSCPSPASILPLTEENLRRFGDACFDALSSLSSCRYPQDLPQDLSPACRAYLTDAFSYNGCVERSRSTPSFNANRWRIFLGSTSDVWRNSHDAIRLRDAQGRTVDVFVY